MGIWTDIRYALRTLRKNPGYTSVALLSLALGIGANTAIYSLIDELMLRPLSPRIADPQRLAILNVPEERSVSAYCYYSYTQLRERNSVFSGLVARHVENPYVSVNGNMHPADVEFVSADYFSVLGVKPYLGRTFTPDEDRIPGTPVAVISHGFWLDRFGSDPSVVGRTIQLDNHPFTIIGVEPPDFAGLTFGYSSSVFVPLTTLAMVRPPRLNTDWNPFDNPQGTYHAETWQLIGRLKPGVSFAQAEASLRPVYAGIRHDEAGILEWGSAIRHRTDEDRQRFLARWIALRPGGRGFAGSWTRFRQPLIALMALVAVVLLIACSTVANLLLARCTARDREITVRLALGAGRFRVGRQFLVESLLLSVFGAGLGTFGAWWAAGALLAVVASWGHTIEVTPDLRILGFTVGISLLTGLICGLAPVWQASRTEVAAALKNQGASLTGDPSHLTMRKCLIVAQLALSVLLLAGAGIFVRTLWALKTLDTGIDRTHVLLVPVGPEPLRPFTPAQRQQYYRGIVQRLQGLPGVRSTAVSWIGLFTGRKTLWKITVAGRPPQPEEQNLEVAADIVTASFFDTVGLRLIAGRIWRPEDDSRPVKEVVVSRRFARDFFPTENPIGHSFTCWLGGFASFEIIGVVEDSKYANLRQEVLRAAYFPYSFDSANSAVYVRTSGNPARMIPALRREIENYDGKASLGEIRPLEHQVDTMLLQERLVAWLASFFGLIAALLAALGLYGVISFAVLRRTREIGVRVALGARRANILQLVLREVMALALAGVALGVPAAFALSHLAQAMVFGIAPNDLPTIAGAALLMCLIALVAGYLPARRATRMSPMVALRCE